MDGDSTPGENSSNEWVAWKARNALIFFQKGFNWENVVKDSKILPWKILNTKSCDLWHIWAVFSLSICLEVVGISLCLRLISVL